MLRDYSFHICGADGVQCIKSTSFCSIFLYTPLYLHKEQLSFVRTEGFYQADNLSLHNPAVPAQLKPTNIQ